MGVIRASWVEGFAARLMQLRPGKHPLDAVREATRNFEHQSTMSPEAAAEDFVATSAADLPRSLPPRNATLADED
jgi:hypothetical protein